MKLHIHFLNSLLDFGKIQYGSVEFYHTIINITLLY